jgi:hypothetical protein
MAGTAMSAAPEKSTANVAQRRATGDFMRIAPNAENCVRTMFSPHFAAA